MLKYFQTHFRDTHWFYMMLQNIFLLGAVLFISVSCAQSPLAVGTKQEVKPGAILYADDFSKIPGGWGTWSRDGSTVEYHDGGLRFYIDEAQYDFWSVSGKHFTDVRVDVDAIKLNGPDDNDFGVICRYQDKDNFYMLVASSDGYYGIAKMKDGQYHMIGPNQLQYSESLKRGLAVNHLQAACVGSTLSLSANNQKLMEATDTDFTAGDIGLLAGSYNTTGIEILFDNLVVTQP